MIRTAQYTIQPRAEKDLLWVLSTAEGQRIEIMPPAFEIEGERIDAYLSSAESVGTPLELSHGVIEHRVSGTLRHSRDLSLTLVFRVIEGSPIIRFRYELHSTSSCSMTRGSGCDQLVYYTARLAQDAKHTEIRLSEFSELVHSFRLSERPIDMRHMENGVPWMGPMLVSESAGGTSLLAYEHGSQAPDSFLQFRSAHDRTISLEAVKGNYWDGRVVAPGEPFKTIWFQAGLVHGGRKSLQEQYRSFMLHGMSQNLESRKPYIYYNTWNFQERNKWWNGRHYLDSMTEDRILAEIDRAHEMGIDVFVIDTGWYEKTGDWRVDTTRFPNGLAKVNKLLDRYGMKLGLWFNPTVAAASSDLLRRLPDCRSTRHGEIPPPRAVWETEESYSMCLVSRYADAFADELIRLYTELGVTYFKWDAIGQYGCDDPGHNHGTEVNSETERADSYAFELGRAMVHVVDRLCAACPDAIVDFDITEGHRFVGLGFLSAGKYFLINNGPYFSSLDLPGTIDGNPNVYFYGGEARGWVCRTPLDYDTWIPSVLFLTHYLPDDPQENQRSGVASLVLGHNGIWGDLLSISDEGVRYIGAQLERYKAVAEDVTQSYPVTSGRVGGSPEIHEKILPETGRGLVSIFAGERGSYTYVTNAKVDQSWHAPESFDVSIDADGRAIIVANFQSPGGDVVFFGE